jgi:hypothetical protein
MAKASATAWTCDRCQVTVSWSSGEKSRTLPTGWAKRGKTIHCLACRRELAGEEAVEALGEDATTQARQKASASGRVEFEIRRDPSVADGEIAKAARTSIAAVRSARERLGLQGERRG